MHSLKELTVYILMAIKDEFELYGRDHKAAKRVSLWED